MKLGAIERMKATPTCPRLRVLAAKLATSRGKARAVRVAEVEALAPSMRGLGSKGIIRETKRRCE